MVTTIENVGVGLKRDRDTWEKECIEATVSTSAPPELQQTINEGETVVEIEVEEVKAEPGKPEEAAVDIPEPEAEPAELGELAFLSLFPFLKLRPLD
jgi:hypothetical protein